MLKAGEREGAREGGERRRGISGAAGGRVRGSHTGSGKRQEQDNTNETQKAGVGIRVRGQISY